MTHAIERALNGKKQFVERLRDMCALHPEIEYSATGCLDNTSLNIRKHIDPLGYLYRSCELVEMMEEALQSLRVTDARKQEALDSIEFCREKLQLMMTGKASYIQAIARRLDIMEAALRADDNVCPHCDEPEPFVLPPKDRWITGVSTEAGALNFYSDGQMYHCKPQPPKGN